MTNYCIRGKNGAAELINVKPTTLEAKMARLGIQRNRYVVSRLTLQAGSYGPECPLHCT
jgi:hypothetical protein